MFTEPTGAGKTTLLDEAQRRLTGEIPYAVIDCAAPKSNTAWEVLASLTRDLDLTAAGYGTTPVPEVRHRAGRHRPGLHRADHRQEAGAARTRSEAAIGKELDQLGFSRADLDDAWSIVMHDAVLATTESINQAAGGLNTGATVTRKDVRAAPTRLDHTKNAVNGAGGAFRDQRHDGQLHQLAATGDRGRPGRCIHRPEGHRPAQLTPRHSLAGAVRCVHYVRLRGGAGDHAVGEATADPLTFRLLAAWCQCG
ncbi:hypothetical protein [Saccharothrix syringae]|uniref:Uncharacterized protein n=1 Tax=Saccharothrix syringae TaxID=103733 RepID=A0A5Q0H3W2_SACSY|nr:hypothetical protein [Saccharothrix syringae]QFZ20412.1 hypothetical protein EKG83_26010 [Saccharothrix syringae]